MQGAGHMEVRGGQVGQLRARAPAGARARCGRPPGGRQVSLQRPHDGQHVRDLPGRNPDLQACWGSQRTVTLLTVPLMGRQSQANKPCCMLAQQHRCLECVQGLGSKG